MSRPRARVRPAASDGQAAVELMAILPLVGVLLVAAWQVAVAGWAAWSTGTAARAAARAHAVGGDPERAARGSLPASLERGLRVRAGADGEISITVGVPLVAGGGQLTSLTQRARFAPQEP